MTAAKARSSHASTPTSPTCRRGRSAGWLYFLASPENATERYLYRSKLDGTGAPERVTPEEQPGTHGYDARARRPARVPHLLALRSPPVIDVVDLPTHRSLRALTDTIGAAAKLAHVLTPPVEFFTVDIGDGVVARWLDAEAGGLRRVPQAIP